MCSIEFHELNSVSATSQSQGRGQELSPEGMDINDTTK